MFQTCIGKIACASMNFLPVLIRVLVIMFPNGTFMFLVLAPTTRTWNICVLKAPRAGSRVLEVVHIGDVALGCALLTWKIGTVTAHGQSSFFGITGRISTSALGIWIICSHLSPKLGCNHILRNRLCTCCLGWFLFTIASCGTFTVLNDFCISVDLLCFFQHGRAELWCTGSWNCNNANSLRRSVSFDIKNTYSSHWMSISNIHVDSQTLGCNLLHLDATHLLVNAYKGKSYNVP